jgi:(E)-4-hydroxy-3-methylbut-2-enyl-diphosphate synthase
LPHAYAIDPYTPRRRLTREVRVGDVGVGGDNPVRIQSMTTTDTMDTRATVEQARRLVEAGCEIVRVTAPSLREAENLAAIAAALRAGGVRVPLVADIHYTPNAALRAAEYVEKVRINPGNYADKKRFEVREYSDAQWAEELERVAERFRPLVRRCKELGRAMRIGTNHGSLADRILNRYGDTPRGMVESALEFLDVCEDEGYRDVIFSMKASNPAVAIQAYRLLAARLAERSPGEPGHPFHVGVTEAGDGIDGRVKSGIGIGALLEDGIGDTIRVSLTEDPVKEIPVARALAEHCTARWRSGAAVPDPGAPFSDDPYAGRRRATRSLPLGALRLGGAEPVRVEVELGLPPTDPESRAREVAGSLAELKDVACESLVIDVYDPGGPALAASLLAALRRAGVTLPVGLRVEAAWSEPCAQLADRLIVPVGGLVPDDRLVGAAKNAVAAGIPLEWELRGSVAEMVPLLDRALAASAAAGLEELLVSAEADLPVHGARLVAARLEARGAADVPIVLRHRRRRDDDPERALVRAAVDLGAPLCDGVGDLVSLADTGEPAAAALLAYRILQGARLRTSWTEFISCPSCGRTLFDLEETTARIKSRTGHLKGVKIAVMGCIVNGPGEMADADFGYVGSGPGQVNLYVGQECVERKVPSAEADDRLVELIRAHGRWIDP